MTRILAVPLAFAAAQITSVDAQVTIIVHQVKLATLVPMVITNAILVQVVYRLLQVVMPFQELLQMVLLVI